MADGGVYEEVPEYKSDEEEIQIIGERPPQKKQRGGGRDWRLKATFKTAAKAESAVKEAGCWGRDSNKGKGLRGRKVFFRCNKGPTCPAGVYIHYHADDFGVSKDLDFQ